MTEHKIAPAREGKSVDRALGTRKAIADTPPLSTAGLVVTAHGMGCPRGRPSLAPHPPLPWRMGCPADPLEPANHMQIEVTPGEIRDA